MNRKIYLLLAAPLMFILSCGEAHTEADDNEEFQAETAPVDDSYEMGSESSFKLDLIIANNIAAPVKLLTDMNEAGLNNYQDDITNPTDKQAEYVTSDEKAICFGVYGADLSYQSLYGKNQEMANYLIAITNLSDDLGLSNLFDQSSFQKFENIKTNPDSVKLFIFEKYDEADGYLRSNDRMVTAALILTGGLIESLHLVSSQIEHGDTNKEAYLIFLEQKNTLKSLLELYMSLEKEGHKMAYKSDIESLLTKFQDVDYIDKFSKENIENLHVAIDQVRDKMI